ncbi:MAG TPA: hypothetical protein VN696_09540 [Pyrinomonadaceae bacterium]|jgi:predicted small secreted protein|nr:hypothetical protein [Pyrinomonadaceae bacterium]
MKRLVIFLLIMLSLFACGCSGVTGQGHDKNAVRLTDDERHRLYGAALAASDSPMDTDTFKDVCRTIGIFDATGKPNDQYLSFVSQHVDWATKSETDEFRGEINSREKARQYISSHLPTR